MQRTPKALGVVDPYLVKYTVVTIRRIATLVGLGLAIVSAVWCALYFALGVWPPDIGAGKRAVLATAESAGGEHFKVVQFWNGVDFYTTQVEHTSPDGTESTAVIDSDDRKQWPCSAKVIESEKKLVIILSDRSPPIEYIWDKKWFVTLPGWQRVRP